tara:strand:+ start:440 stop:739 length:300 start_codon:yes stop_codon:yes gene_type:complete
MSVLTYNQSNIEMRDVQDLKPGDIVIRTDFSSADGALIVKGFVVIEIEHSDNGCFVHVEELRVLSGRYYATYKNTYTGQGTQKWWDMDKWDTIAVAVGS